MRWKVTTGVGPGGYVESLAFPSSVGSQSPVIVRFAFDAGGDGPPLSDMDRITRGIRSVGEKAAWWRCGQQHRTVEVNGPVAAGCPVTRPHA